MQRSIVSLPATDETGQQTRVKLYITVPTHVPGQPSQGSYSFELETDMGEKLVRVAKGVYRSVDGQRELRSVHPMAP